ncbi:MAG: peptidase C39 family protein [Candidatus Sulfomarinibacteraceae bacterium]
MDGPPIRHAGIDDLDALVALEERCFTTDRLSRRNFRYMLTDARAATLVLDDGRTIGGYVLVLFSKGTALARLYSIAVDAAMRGRGVGRALIESAEDEALGRGCVSMRSEVRQDNTASRTLFERAGYQVFDEVDDYYEDHMGALRFERILAPRPDLSQVRVPYYQQTTDFTCGPACLMMAMRALDEGLDLDRRTELRLWRESTSIYMTSGHGGCGPYGLALAAHNRGFRVELFVKESGPFLIDTVRSEEKKEVMRVVEEDFLDQLATAGISIHHRPLAFDELRGRFAAGAIPVVLISSHRIYEERFPHWLVLTGFDRDFVYAHDPFVDDEEGESVSDCVNMPIARLELERMARYGRSGQRAVLVIEARG